MSTVLSGSNLRASISVSIVLALAFTFTGFLSSAYKRARENQGRMHYQIGETLRKTGNVEGAAEEYRKALLFLPDDPEYSISLSVALIELGKIDEAESHLHELLEDDPTNGQINLMMARVAERRNRTTQAIEYFQRSVYGYWPTGKLASRHAARWELVELLEKQNRPNEVVGELLQLYANAPPNDAEERSKIGFLLLHYRATSDAVNMFSELARNFPKFVEAYHGLGQAYFDSGDYPAAKREFQRAARLDPKDHENLSQLALATEVIEIDPMLPGLSSAERVKKNKALLTRILADVRACAPNNPSDTLTQDLDQAAKLLNSSYTDADDFATRLQDTSVGLWKNRKSYCGDGTRDKVAETVLARVTS